MRRLLSIALIIALITINLTIGCEKKPSEIKIGAILVLTGPDAKAGQSAKQGIDLAVEEINEKGIKGRKIKVIYEDDQGEPQKATSAAMKLIEVDKVSVILGPMWSSSVLAVAPIAESKHLVILTPIASSPKITYAGDYIFRNTYSDIFEGTKTAEYTYYKLNYKKLGILYINNDFGLGLKEVVSNRFREVGGEIIIAEGYDPKSTDFRSHLSKIKQRNLDALYVVGFSEVGQLLKQAKEISLNIPVISSIMFEISDIIKIAGNAAEGVIYAYVSYDPKIGDSETLKFAGKYKEKFGYFPDPEAAFSYDAMKILTSVISKVGTDAEKIKNELYQVKDFHGVTGNTTFDKNGDVIKPIGFKKVVNGKYVWETFEFK